MAVKASARSPANNYLLQVEHSQASATIRTVPKPPHVPNERAGGCKTPKTVWAAPKATVVTMPWLMVASIVRIDLDTILPIA
jgi:hypothetical protein